MTRTDQKDNRSQVVIVNRYIHSVRKEIKYYNPLFRDLL